MWASETTNVELTDGRTVKASEYPDGSIRLKVSGLPGVRYAMTECFLPGQGHEAIIKLELLEMIA